jgi:hypothetical protein
LILTQSESRQRQEKERAEMDKGFLAELRNEILFRVHKVLNDRYGDSVPSSLWDGEVNKEDAFEAIRRIESFKSDENLIHLLETL